MMNSKYLMSLVLALAATSLVTGCGDKPSSASPACADLDKITDPAQKEELLKKCPRSGPAFKPSEKKNW